MTNMRSVEVGAVLQALIVGQVVNGLTGESITSSFSVDVAMRYPGEVAFRAFPVTAKILAAGYFSFSASPERVLPLLLDSADSLDIRFSISVSGYDSFEEIVSVGAASVTPVTTEEELAGHQLEVSLVAAPIVQRIFSLTPLAVGLNGVVIEDNDTDIPLANASVQVVAPETGVAVMSDAQGRYRIDSLPVSESVTLQVELDAELTTIDHVIDYTRPFNTRIISLNG